MQAGSGFNVSTPALRQAAGHFAEGAGATRAVAGGLASPLHSLEAAAATRPIQAALHEFTTQALLAMRLLADRLDGIATSFRTSVWTYETAEVDAQRRLLRLLRHVEA